MEWIQRYKCMYKWNMIWLSRFVFDWPFGERIGLFKTSLIQKSVQIIHFLFTWNPQYILVFSAPLDQVSFPFCRQRNALVGKYLEKKAKRPGSAMCVGEPAILEQRHHHIRYTCFNGFLHDHWNCLAVQRQNTVSRSIFQVWAHSGRLNKAIVSLARTTFLHTHNTSGLRLKDFGKGKVQDELGV